MSKRLVVTLAIILSLAVAGHALMPETLSRHPAYTITKLKSVISPQAGTMTENVETQSFREDGSEAVTVGLTKDDRGVVKHPGGSYILDRKNNQQIIVAPSAGGKMTFALNKLVGFRKYKSNCSDKLTDTAKFVGPGAILGVSVVQFHLEYPNEPGTEEYYWFAPSLNCALVKHKLIQRDQNNQIAQIMMTEPLSINTEANAEAFTAGDHYPERSPAELHTEHVKNGGNPPVACESQGIADLELRYRKGMPIR